MDACVAGLFDFVCKAYGDGDKVVGEHRKLDASYAIGVVFPDGSDSLKAQLTSEDLHSRLDAIHALREAAAVGRADRSPPRAVQVLRSEVHAEKG